ncbi:50S ribosomal protein L9 [Acetobacter indonesiensis]|jgi:large subunit ribosomal protein L9|uniref:Large ribosomal subunit protein bL9 n=1 Tax=Acetobacter indonesiensis TaxID=104101 RepID=A0A252AWR8_9PROT|nr:50S ribosomal protein L9 [Acetobacter indonesiensis]MCG0994169.1 50S ribosomal protein L9 [Acetobacter indonesiensis]MCI1438230.1 50S ribosomal protein L9 [Acetobacter indonesiensis]MCI1545176.1 50S ribosomal protein L9 [Acetobacter indonesiensis]MCI1764580.1 50S ribosomal protein L9 [Acetobacter indonesiensis]OUI95165.1 50S ribosomal protein L9 [Acetobacter indonesiensis]
MAVTEVILLQRVEHLGQMGDVVKVRPGYARNFLLPQGKAIRANEANRSRFDRERAQLEAQNIKRREEAERLSERMEGLAVILIRQAGDSGSLYGSVSPRDVSEAVTEAGFTVSRQQVSLSHPIKSLGLYEVTVALHPEVSVPVIVNVARSAEEAERQALGEAVSPEEEAEAAGDDLLVEGEIVADDAEGAATAEKDAVA